MYSIMINQYYDKWIDLILVKKKTFFLQVSAILKKPEHERTKAEKALVSKNPDAVKTFEKNARRLKANKERILEVMIFFFC